MNEKGPGRGGVISVPPCGVMVMALAASWVRVLADHTTEAAAVCSHASALDRKGMLRGRAQVNVPRTGVPRSRGGGRGPKRN